MPLKVKPVNIRERDELEPLIMDNPDVIEQGLRVIAHQFPTDSGLLDILAVDTEGTLVVIELKNEAAEGHLDQGLRYYDWCRANIAWLAQAFSSKVSSKDRINSDASPRLILIAPTFTDTVKRIAKYVDVELQLFEYHAFEDNKGERGLLCTEVDFGQPPEPPAIPTIEKKMEYFQDAKVRELFKAVLSELQELGIEARPIYGLWISFWYKNKRFMVMSTNRNFFAVDILSPSGNWIGRQRVRTREDWKAFLNNYITEYIKYLEGQRSEEED